MCVKVRGQLSVLIPFFYYVHPRNQTQVLKFGGKATFIC